MPDIADLLSIIAHIFTFGITVVPAVIIDAIFNKRIMQIHRFNTELQKIVRSPKDKQNDMFKEFNRSWGIEKPNELFLVLSCAYIPIDKFTSSDINQIQYRIFIIAVVCILSFIYSQMLPIVVYLVCFINLLYKSLQHPGISDILITEFDYETYLDLKNKYCKYGKYI